MLLTYLGPDFTVCILTIFDWRTYGILKLSHINEIIARGSFETLEIQVLQITVGLPLKATAQ